MKHPIFLVLLTCAMAVGSFAQTSLTSLEEALTLATRQNAGLQAGVFSQELAQKDVQIARGNLLPFVGFAATGDYNYRMPVQLIPAIIFGGAPGEYEAIQFGQPYVANMSVDVAMPLYAPDRRQARETAQKMALQTAYQLEKQVETVKFGVISAYYQHLLYKAVIGINEQQIALADSLKYVAEQKQANDLLNPADYNRVLNLVNNVRMALESNRARYEQSALALKQWLHVPLELPLTVEGQLNVPVKKAAQTTEAAALQRPGYLMQTAAAETALSQLKEKQAARLPKLSLNARHSLQFQFDHPFSETATSNVFDFGSVGLNFQAPLFRGKTLTLQAERAQVRHRQALQESAQALEQSRKELLEWQLLRDEAFVNAPAAKANADRSAENVNIGLKRYEEGLSDLTEYFNVYSEYVQAQQAYLQVLMNANVYQAMIDLQ